MSIYWIERLIYLRVTSIALMFVTGIMVFIYIMIIIASVFDSHDDFLPKIPHRSGIALIIFFIISYLAFLFIPSETELYQGRSKNEHTKKISTKN